MSRYRQGGLGFSRGGSGGPLRRAQWSAMTHPISFWPRNARPWWGLMVWLLACVPLTALASPRLHCQVTYAGTTHTVTASPQVDPYTVPSVDIGGRFRFKAVMVGSASQVDRIALYAYRTDDLPQPLLIHQAKYLPPFARSSQPLALTGEQRLYAGPLERELIYSCTLEGQTP